MKSGLLLALLRFAGLSLFAGTTNVTPLALEVLGANQLRVAWPVRSVVPAPGRRVFARYQLENSSDLKTWQPVGSPLDGTNHTSLEVVVTAAASGTYFRLRSDVSLPGAILRQAKLDNADLRDADLQNADVSQASLTGADLRGAGLFGISAFNAALNNADLRGADLSAADLRNANLDGAQLDGANLFAARLGASVLDGATLTGANLRFAELAGASLFQADLTDADLGGASFSRADLGYAVFQGTHLDAMTTLPDKWRQVWHIVNESHPGEILTNLDLSFGALSGLTLTNCNFGGSDLSFADFTETDLRGANFAKSNLRFVFWNGSLIDDATTLSAKARLNWQIVNEPVTGRILPNADLSSLVLAKAKLNEANLRGANLNQSSLFQTQLRKADLSNANLAGANLTEADLTGAKLTGANLAGAIFDHTIMPDGSLRGPGANW